MTRSAQTAIPTPSSLLLVAQSETLLETGEQRSYGQQRLRRDKVDGMIKLVFTLRRRDGMSREEFQRYWREQHAPLVARHARALRIRRYIQVHARETDLDAAISAS